jgi:hypothetical protein
LTLNIVVQVFDMAKIEDEVPWTEFRDKYWLPEVHPSIRKNGKFNKSGRKYESGQSSSRLHDFKTK